jgi:carboxypeptidase Q
MERIQQLRGRQHYFHSLTGLKIIMLKQLVNALAAIFILFCSSSAYSQATDSAMMKKISDEILTNGQAYTNLRFLCKKVGPRLSGSPQAARSVVETARMLKLAGADTVYLQECLVPHWVRGAKEVATLKLSNGKLYPLKVAALGNSVGTPASGINAPVIEVKNFDELHKLGTAAVKGKIVFFNYPMNPTYISTFRAYGEAGIYRGRGPSMAAKYGAVGVITRTLSPNLDDHPHTGSTVYNDSFPKLPAIAVSTNDAEYLSKALSTGAGSTVYFKTNCKMLAETVSHNVVGEIRGTELPDEVITVGGHLDSWDLAEGAHDDGAGCVQSIEVIRAMKAAGIKPKRTIRAVMFMNEENGLRGGLKYAEIAKTENKKFIFALESDAGGFTPRGFGVSATVEQKDKIFSWQPLFVPYGAGEFTVGGGGADIGPLRPLGTAMAGLNPDSQRYMDLHHATTDVFEAVSERELKLGAVVMAQLVWLVSEYGL